VITEHFNVVIQIPAWSPRASCDHQQLHGVTGYRHPQATFLDQKHFVNSLHDIQKKWLQDGEVLGSSYDLHKFSWPGQKDTPVTDARGVVRLLMWSSTASCGHQLPTSASTISGSKTLCKIFGQSHMVTESSMWSPTALCGHQLPTSARNVSRSKNTL
jgi:hypothetical protein